METILTIGIVIAGGLAYYFLKKQQDKKKGLISAGVAVVLFILFGIFIVEPENNKKENQTEQDQIESQEVKEDEEPEETDEVEENVEEDGSEDNSEETTEEIVEEKQFDDSKEQIVHNVFGEELRNYYTLEEDDMIDVYIEVDLPLGLTENMMKRSFEYDVVDLAEQMKDEDFTNFIVIAYAEGSDAYGNDTEVSAGTITISKETANQINYENFNIDNLETIADSHNLNIGK